ncbi:MAG: M3 family oligoendopeptidase [Chloroflexota bacterium]
MFDKLPQTALEAMDWSWADYEPYYDELAERPFNADTVGAWLADWTRIGDLFGEVYTRLHVARTRNTTDADISARFEKLLDNLLPQVEAAEQTLKQKLLDSKLEPAGFEIPLRNMRTEAALFREANLPLLSEEQKLRADYDKIIGAQTVVWQGEEITLTRLKPVYESDDRALREEAWRLASTRQLADRDALNALWVKNMDLRGRIAANAGEPDYRAYMWKAKLRFDYTPEDCETFQNAIEEVVVPAAKRIHEKRRAQLGLSSVRPWDLDVDALGRSPLHPYDTIADLIAKASTVFHQVDPQLGGYFDIMRQRDLLDLDNRKGKAPGGYNASYETEKVPFIFMNAVGVSDEVRTITHEGGHAFHVFETNDLPYKEQKNVPLEFAEVASMSMELLASPYLNAFYNEADVARHRIEHIEKILLFWPYMAVVDAFQHWAYTRPQDGQNPAKCDAKWGELWARFMPAEDWSGLDDAMQTGWHRKQHIFRRPFYYVEYGLAQLGAVMVWKNALADQAGAVKQYRKALSLGYTRSLPELFQAAGARFAFDVSALREAVDLLEGKLAELEAV